METFEDVTDLDTGDLTVAEFLELMLFERTYETEGDFLYAFENSPPRFPAGHQTFSANECTDDLIALLRTYADRIETFWDREDAMDLYDRAVAASEARERS